MKKVVLLVLLSLLLVLPAHAQSIAEQEAGILGAQTLTEGLDEEALERLGGVSPTAPADLAASLWRLLTDALHDVRTLRQHAQRQQIVRLRRWTQRRVLRPLPER